jgi:hypothetical protein
MAQQAVLAALGRPKPFYQCQAVLLGCGGDDGLWMRLLGSGVDDLHRVGSLVVAEDRLGYAESYATRPLPRSAIGMIALARRNVGLRQWVWTARSDEITALAVGPAVDSPHGVYSTVTIDVGGTSRRFGLGRGEGPLPEHICALNYLLGGGDLGMRESMRDPRTDGVYVCARADIPGNHVWAYAFDDGHATFFVTDQLQTTLQTLHSGESTFERAVYRRDGASHTAKDGASWFAVISQDRLMYGQAEWPAAGRWFGRPYMEMQFISDDELAAGWGRTRASLVESPWPAVLSATGTLQAPDIGASPEWTRQQTPG